VGGGLSGAYSEAKQVEAKLKRDELEWQKQHQTEKFMWDKENYEDSFQLKKKEVKIKEQMVAEETKRQFYRDQEEKTLKPETILNKPRLFLMH